MPDSEKIIKNFSSFLDGESPLSVFKIGLALFLLFNISGCLSYINNGNTTSSKVLMKFNGEPVIPRDANRVVVPFFSNFTNKPVLSDKLTLKLRELINMDGRLAIVSESSQADLIVTGKIVHYQIQPIQYDTIGRAVRMRMRIISSVKLRDIRRGETIFFDRGIQAFGVYSDLIPPIETEAQVQDKILKNLARRIAVKIIDGWYTDLMTSVETRKK